MPSYKSSSLHIASDQRSDFFDILNRSFWYPLKNSIFLQDLSVPASIPTAYLQESSAFVFRVDWKETPEAHVFKADVPGLKKEEVKVEVEDDRELQISGERNNEKEDQNDKWHCVERSSGKFLRKFGLPENAKMDQIKASTENGVLTITVPKQETKKPQVKSTEISG